MRPDAESRERYRRVSGRNQLTGKVVSVKCAGLLAEVVLAVARAKVTAIITADAVREMGLEKSDSAAALIKSMNVMIENGLMTTGIDCLIQFVRFLDYTIHSI